jgi:hypothetical protein
MKRVRVFLILWSLGLLSSDVYADVGVIRLHAAQGSFVVTIFTGADPVQASPADVSIVVQNRNSNDILLDASVDLIFKPPGTSVFKPTEALCGPSAFGAFDRATPSHITSFTIPASHRLAANKLFYVALVKFDASGNWQMEALVKYGTETATFTCNIPVGSKQHQFATLAPYLALPPLIVALFVTNQLVRGPKSNGNRK